MHPHHLLLLATLALAPTTALAVPAYTITDLDTLGGGFSEGFDINDRGQVTGTSVTTDGANHAFLWDSMTGMRDLGTLGGGFSEGAGINVRGQVVGTSSIADGTSRTFLWDQTTGMQNIGTLGGSQSRGSDINAHGQVTGTIVTESGRFRAFLWDSVTGVRDLGNLGGSSSQGLGINDNGQVTGESATTDGTIAFRWDLATGMRNLGGLLSRGNDINASGQVTGWIVQASADFYAVIWNPVGGIQDLGNLGGPSQGFGINASGQVTGTSGTEDNAIHAFLWDGTDMFDLNDLIPPGAGWTLQSGNAINDAGQITGFGIDPGGQANAFLLTPVTVAEVPEPGTLALIAVGGIGLSLVRHRRRQND